MTTKPTAVPAPSTPGFETLFGMIPLGPIERKTNVATDALDAFLKRDRAPKTAINTTSDNTTLVALGLNPSAVDNHFNVSLTPVRFRKLGSLGWGHTYEAIHSCNLYSEDGKVGEVAGMEFSVENGRSVRETWERERYERDDD